MVTMPACKVEEKVALPTLVRLRVDKSVPTGPFTVTVPNVSKASDEAVPPAVPLMESVVMGVPAPAPSNRLAPFARMMAGKVMAPVLEPPI